MLSEGVLGDADRMPGPEEDQRRRYYRIAALGREVARAEARRLERVLEVAREKTADTPGRMARSSPAGASMRSTARSFSGATPTSGAGQVEWSARVTRAAFACWITWVVRNDVAARIPHEPASGPARNLLHVQRKRILAHSQ
jgi:hypothetical protein